MFLSAFLPNSCAFYSIIVLQVLSLSGLRIRMANHVCNWMVRLCRVVGFVLGWINCNHNSSVFFFSFFTFFTNNHQPPTLLHRATSTHYIKLLWSLWQLVHSFSDLGFLILETIKQIMGRYTGKSLSYYCISLHLTQHPVNSRRITDTLYYEMW